MQQKIMTFVISNNKILILRNNPKDPRYGGDFWYTVTGNFELNEVSGEEVVKREVKEETNLDVQEIIDLNWHFNFFNNGYEYIEYVYATFVKQGEIILNEEHVDYRWCDLKEFVEKIKWYGDKKELKKVLEKALQKEKYFSSVKLDIKKED